MGGELRYNGTAQLRFLNCLLCAIQFSQLDHEVSSILFILKMKLLKLRKDNFPETLMEVESEPRCSESRALNYNPHNTLECG